MAIDSKLNLYIFKQLTVLFYFTVGLISGLGVAIGTISDLAYKINNYNLPLTIALKIFILKIPEYVAYGLPIATLLTTLVVYGRANSDRELVAFRSVGISFYKIMLPALYFSFIVTILTLITNETIAPQTNHQIALLQQPFLPESQFALQQKNFYYPEYRVNSKQEKQLERLYFAESFRNDRLNNVVVASWKDRQLVQVITAKYAHWNTELKLWNMQQAVIDNLGRDIFHSAREIIDRYQVALPITFFKIVNSDRDPEAMSLTEARNYLKLIINSGNLQKIRLFRVRIQQKLAFPFICIVFALIGSTIGATFNNLNRGQSFGFCVAIAFGYYVLGFAFGSIGIAGLISPIIAAWLPNVIGLGCGLWLLRSANCGV